MKKDSLQKSPDNLSKSGSLSAGELESFRQDWLRGEGKLEDWIRATNLDVNHLIDADTSLDEDQVALIKKKQEELYKKHIDNQASTFLHKDLERILKITPKYLKEYCQEHITEIQRLLQEQNQNPETYSYTRFSFVNTRLNFAKYYYKLVQGEIEDELDIHDQLIFTIRVLEKLDFYYNEILNNRYILPSVDECLISKIFPATTGIFSKLDVSYHCTYYHRVYYGVKLLSISGMSLDDFKNSVKTNFRKDLERFKRGLQKQNKSLTRQVIDNLLEETKIAFDVVEEVRFDRVSGKYKRLKCATYTGPMKFKAAFNEENKRSVDRETQPYITALEEIKFQLTQEVLLLPAQISIPHQDRVSFKPMKKIVIQRLKEMHKRLVENKCIACDDQEFIAIFKHTPDFTPINWISGLSQLHYFIILLITHGIIDVKSQPRFWVTASHCFSDKGVLVSSVRLGKSKPPCESKKQILEAIVKAYVE